jgi:mRNA interferase MazF
MRRGEIWWANLDPAVGSEAARSRPVLVVSRESGNDAAVALGRGVVTVVPLTTVTENVYPFQVLVPGGAETGLARDSKAQAEHVRAVDVRRLREQLGAADAGTMRRIDAALRLHLEL